MLIRFTNIYQNIVAKSQKKQTVKNFIILVDEPDLHLHPERQRQYIAKLINVFSTLNVSIHFIIATHSPFILSDIPKQNIHILKDGKEILENKENTFGANGVFSFRTSSNIFRYG